jgi:hypothetical protein
MTGYQSSGDLVGPAARPYASGDLNEGQELLRNAQGNPMSRPALQRDESSGSCVDVSTGQYDRRSSDIGIARSIYEGDDDNELVGGSAELAHPLPPRQHWHHGGLDGGQQETGVVPVSHPDRDRVESRGAAYVTRL